MKTASGVELFGRSMESVPDGEDRPVGLAPSDALYGSDIVADTLKALNVGFVAFRPDVDFSGLHDSLVNRNGNRQPRLLPCFDSDHAFDIALGYARASGTPMVVGCGDPTLSLPRLRMFAEQRHPLLVFTAHSLSAHQNPGPFKAIFRIEQHLDLQRAISEAYWTCVAEPCGPVRVSLSPELMESLVDSPPQKRTTQICGPQRHSGIGAEKRSEIAEILQEANAPLILAGYLGHSIEEWLSLTAFVEDHGARVVTAFGDRAVFDSRHPLHVGEIGGLDEEAARAAYEAADVVIALNWSEWGRLRKSGTGRRRSFLIDVGVVSRGGGDRTVSVDSNTDLPDIVITTTPAEFLREFRTIPGVEPAMAQQAVKSVGLFPDSPGSDAITPDGLMAALQREIGDQPATLAHVPRDWRGAAWPASGPLDDLGSMAAGGLGAAVGAALALNHTGRLLVALVDGVEFVAEATRLWTAVHFELPLLVIVLNRASIPSAKKRQAQIARLRNREGRNAAIGTGFNSPDIQFTDIARAFAATGLAPVSKISDLTGALSKAVSEVRDGRVAALGVHLECAGHEEDE